LRIWSGRRTQAKDSTDALAKALYGRMFSFILGWINSILCNERETLPYVGVLDIFGFEDFQENSFEQFCINYANEKLQVRAAIGTRWTRRPVPYWR